MQEDYEVTKKSTQPLLYFILFLVFLMLFVFLFTNIFIFSQLIRAVKLHDSQAVEVQIDDKATAGENKFNLSGSTTVFVSDQIGYVFYPDDDNTCVYKKTVDAGLTWSAPVVFDSQTDCLRVAVWYDQWTPGDYTGKVIHISTFDSGDDDLWYTGLDTSNDTLSTTVNATGANQGGSFGVAVNFQSITKATNGDLYMGIQDADDSFVIRCLSATDCTLQANWTEAGLASNPFDTKNDLMILMPLVGGNILAIRWDVSANDIDSQVYDSLTDSWDGTWLDIDTDASENSTYDAPFGATLNKKNGRIYLAYGADLDTIGPLPGPAEEDDIRTAVYINNVWQNKTDVITNDPSRGITGVKIAIDKSRGDLYVLYSVQETLGTPGSANIYFKKSSDEMNTWGAAQGPLNATPGNFYGANYNLVSDQRIFVVWYEESTRDILGDTVANITPLNNLGLIGSYYFPQPAELVEEKINEEVDKIDMCTTTREVTLNLKYKNASFVVVSNDLYFRDDNYWQDFTAPQMNLDWVLPEGDGIKTVYILFKSPTNNLSNLIRKKIELNSQGCN